MRIHFDTLDFIFPCLNQAGGVEISGTNDKGDSLTFYLPMDKAADFSKELSEFVYRWRAKVKKAKARSSDKS